MSAVATGYEESCRTPLAMIRQFHRKDAVICGTLSGGDWFGKTEDFPRLRLVRFLQGARC
ncbi:hypothetical protein PABG_12161 [Paracoccidioides brasiliensis Pb03]|nr:hypothetical protein PABG_12161 [Paracoccidioides brasiliensis Pb03]